MNATSFSKVDKAAFYRFIQGRPDGRYELDRGYIVQQMTGGTLRHSLVGARIRDVVKPQIDGTSWMVLQDRGVDVGESVRHPDVVVEPVGAPLTSLSTEVPGIIFEVLSPSTTSIDLEVKRAEYLALAPLQAYIVASQDEAACLAWIRGADGRFPAVPVEYGPNDLVAIHPLGIALSIAAIYSGIIDAPPKDTPHG